MGYFSPRQAQTTVKCPECGAPLKIERSCHNVFMHCDQCGKSWPLSQFIQQADPAMEEFLENIYCDRI